MAFRYIYIGDRIASRIELLLGINVNYTFQLYNLLLCWFYSAPFSFNNTWILMTALVIIGSFTSRFMLYFLGFGDKLVFCLTWDDMNEGRNIRTFKLGN